MDNSPVSNACISNSKAIDDALFVIGGKWRMKIIIALFNGHKRFNEIQRSVSPISAKVLTNELKKLSINGFVIRSVDEQDTAYPEYHLTRYSQGLRKMVHALDEWGKNHRNTLRLIAPNLPDERLLPGYIPVSSGVQ